MASTLLGRPDNHFNYTKIKIGSIRVSQADVIHSFEMHQTDQCQGVSGQQTGTTAHHIEETRDTSGASLMRHEFKFRSSLSLKKKHWR